MNIQDKLVQDLWNNLIADSINKKGTVKVSPQQVRNIIYKHLGKPK